MTLDSLLRDAPTPVEAQGVQECADDRVVPDDPQAAGPLILWGFLFEAIVFSLGIGGWLLILMLKAWVE